MKLKKQAYHQNFYRVTDGYYNSYWLGKLTNSFILDGKKPLIEKELNKVYLYMKLHLGLVAINFFLEKLEKIRPTFKLKFIIRGGKKKEFPHFLPIEKQRSRGVINFKSLVVKRKEWKLNQRIFNELVDIKNSSRLHELSKQRDASLRAAIKNRFNMRYAY